MKWVKSPLYYVGNKFNLLEQMVKLFPKDRTIFIDALGGSGVVAINMACRSQFKEVHYNELSYSVYKMFSLMTSENKKYWELVISNILVEHNLIKLSKIENDKSFHILTDEGKTIYYNFRDWIIENWNNLSETHQYTYAYVLSYYTFANMISFKKNNIVKDSGAGSHFIISKDLTSYGKRIWKIEKMAVRFEFELYLKTPLLITNKSYVDIEISDYDKTFMYFDPPYANTNKGKGYNILWNLESDYELFEYLDNLNIKGVKWGMSNVFRHNGVENKHIKDWVLENNYSVRYLNKKYALKKMKGSDQHSGMETIEVYISNYKPDAPEQLKLFA